MGKASTQARIDIQVELDEQRMPTRILWHAEESGETSPKEAKVLRLACWDEEQQQTLCMELRTKKLRIDEMKCFYIDMLGNMSRDILNATGDAHMSERLGSLCEEFFAHYKKELAQQSNQDAS